VPLAHALAPPEIHLLSAGGGTAGDSADLCGTSLDSEHAYICTRGALVADDFNVGLDVYDATLGGITLVSPGGVDQTGTGPGGPSADGTSYFFASPDQLTDNDNDFGYDIYRHKDGLNTLYTGGTRRNPAYWLANSADGERLIFRTSESLVPDDRDGGQYDVYESAGGTITLLSGGDGPYAATYTGSSADGAHVFFVTRESLSPADTDGGQKDVYEWADGKTTLVSGGGNGPYPARFEAVSRAGDRVIFSTSESLSPADTDGKTDLYAWSGGQTTLVTPGTKAYGAVFGGATPDLSRVYFETKESLAAADADRGQLDVYEQAVTGTTRISAGGNGAAGATFLGASGDGSKVIFATAESLDSADTDGGHLDIYERAGGQTLFVSSGGNAPVDSGDALISEDGATVAFTTREPLTADDLDATLRDVYARTAAGLQLVTPGTVNSDSGLARVSANGQRIFFSTFTRLSPLDLDSAQDIYVALLPGSV
jgi:hypothetical protein